MSLKIPMLDQIVSQKCSLERKKSKHSAGILKEHLIEKENRLDQRLNLKNET